MVREGVLFSGFLLSLLLWLGLSGFALVNRLMYERGPGRLRRIAHEIAASESHALSVVERTQTIEHILGRMSRKVVYRMAADMELPTALSSMCAAYSLTRWGLPRIMRDASPHRGGRKWRRVSSLFVLGHLRAEHVHALLELAVHDADRDVAGAAVVVLGRLRDRAAAQILIAALQSQSFSPSRIATQLDDLDIPIDDLIAPLLGAPQPHARFWGVLLLRRYASRADVTRQVAALAGDSHPPVRKAVLQTLGDADPDITIPVALRLLGDGVGWVRGTSIRTLAGGAIRVGNVATLRACAQRISPFLADAEWDVRLAAKESLVVLGPDVWREVASSLDSPDLFARNGSAEVLQNIGLIDVLVDEVGRGATGNDELLNVLERAFREGGAGMIDAAVTRSDPGLAPLIDTMLIRLGFVGVRAPS